jgi:hypothetical protein
VLLLDQGGWHSQPGWKVPDNSTLLPLPLINSKSPKLIRLKTSGSSILDNWLSNPVFCSYEGIRKQCCAAWNKFVDQP